MIISAHKDPVGDAVMPFPLLFSVQKPVLTGEEDTMHLLKEHKMKFEILDWLWHSCCSFCVAASSPSLLRHDITINIFYIIDLA